MVLRAVGVCVEMPHPVVTDIFKELHEPECGLRGGGAETQVLIVGARLWNEGGEIRSILDEIAETNGQGENAGYDPAGADELLQRSFDREELSSKDLKYERLEQLTMDILFGVR